MTAEKEAPPPAYSEYEQQQQQEAQQQATLNSTNRLSQFVAQAVAANAQDAPPALNVEPPAPERSQYPDEKRGYEPGKSVAAYMVPDDALNRPHILTADSYIGNPTNGPSSGEQLDPDAVPPPAYSETYGTIVGKDTDLGTDARLGDDGRINIKIDQRTNKLSQLLAPALREQLAFQRTQQPPPPPYIPPCLGGSPGELPPPPLNVVIQVVGSRGDVQPFIALGKVLKETYKHRVRLATHPNFKSFVEENGLEFFSIGGDPSELMAFMVKNPGLMPGFDTLRNGDVGARRRGIAEMIKGCWRSCIEAGDGSGIEASDSTIGSWIGNQDNVKSSDRPFVADAIIANPPSFAHVHCAERLGIPLHMMFTMPWSATQAFPQPLANITSSTADPNMTNYLSYYLVDMLTWQGLGDVVNRFRVYSLGLEPLSLLWAPGLLDKLRIPYTYCWSPALIPKPTDWGQHISIAGFYFLSLAANYTPDPALQAFLKAGPPPVYIGFGSIVVDDPNAMTELIFEAVRQTGQRALVSKGWGGIGGNDLNIPSNVFMLGNVPHDWLFQHVSCVVHHGGAGTTAAGIAQGKPTVIVPFFGDQPFWGAMVAKAGAGPEPIPHRQLTAEKLAAAILDALKPASLERALEMKSKISQERGSDRGAQTFHQMLDVDKLRCSLIPEHAAVWRVRRTQIRLSALAAYILAEKEIITFADLKPYRPREYETDIGPPDVVSGATGALGGTVTQMMMGVADMPIATLRALKIHPDSAKANSSAGIAANGIAGTAVSSEAAASRTSLASLGGSDNGGIATLSKESSNDTGDYRQDSVGSYPEEKSTATRDHSRRSFTSDTLSAGDASRSGNRPSASSRNSSRSGDVTPTMSGSPTPSAATGRERSPTSASGSQPYSPSSFAGYTNLVDTALGTGKGLSRIVGAGLKSPMDFTLGLSKGFHNMPKLYGEEVRKVERVTDLQSGLKAAGKEFGLGMFEGVTGLFTKPIAGAQKEGVAGFMKGIGKGIAGVSTKPSAAIFAIPGYTMKGVYKEVQKRFASSVDAYIVAARTAQGWEEYQRTGPEDHKEVVHRYLALLKEVKGKRKSSEDVETSLNQFIEKRKQVRRERWETLQCGRGQSQDRPSQISAVNDAQRGGSDVLETAAPAVEYKGYYAPGRSDSSQLQNQQSQNQQSRTNDRARPASQIITVGLSEQQRLEVERQLREHHGYHSDEDPSDIEVPNSPFSTIAPSTVLGMAPLTAPDLPTPASPARIPAATTRGDAPIHQGPAPVDEDLEEAIRRSIAQSSTGDEDDDEMIARAIRVSIAELRRQRGIKAEEADTDSRDLKKTLAASTSDLSTKPSPGSDLPTKSQAQLATPKPAMPSSSSTQQQPTSTFAPYDTDEEEDSEMARAIAESQKMHDEMERERREEAIVMEYVKKASLAERSMSDKKEKQ